MEGLGIKTTFDEGSNKPSDLPAMHSLTNYSDGISSSPENKKQTIKSINTSNDDNYSYEYYDLDNNHVVNTKPYGDDEDYDDDVNSIQASPIDIAPRKDLPTRALDHQSPGRNSILQVSNNSNTNNYTSSNSTSPSVAHSSAQTSSPSSITTRPSSLPHSESHDKNLSAVAKVRSMFPGFGSYKALNKSSTTQIDQATGPYMYSNESTTSVVEAPHSQYQESKESNFTKVDLDSTYKPQVIQVTNKPESASMSPSLDPNHNEDEVNHQLLRSKTNSESLDFVPNLRPNIDAIGSRLRATGVPSPATLMMTKSQYEKYRMSKGEKDDGDSTEESDDDDDDEDDYSQKARTRGVLEEDDAKKEDIRMRMKQDAHLSVYRQKMTKLTGSQIGLYSVNPGLLSSNSNIPSGDDGLDSESDEDYDDVPLGILKAHGFPTSGRLKTMKSEGNFGEEPNLALPHMGAFGRQAGDTASLRTFQTNFGGPPVTTPEPEEGYLAMRNQSSANMPGFNSSVPMNRGLVGEIAREEEAKRARKNIMNNIMAQRSATMSGSMLDVNDNGSIYNANQNSTGNLSNSGSGGNANSGNGNSNGGNASEIQLQLHQMMQIQTQILQHMATNQTNQMTLLSMPGRMTPMPQQQQQQLVPSKKMWSSFDVMNPGMRPGGAPSIRSVAPSDNHSIRSFGGNQAAQSQPGRPIQSMHQSQNSVPTIDGFRFPSNSPQPGGMPQHQQNISTSVPAPGVGALGPNGANHQKQKSTGTTQLVSVGTDDDDDDEDEAGWKEMEQRKEQLRRLWKAQPAVVL